MSKGKVSIIVPIYNGEKYIDTCLSDIMSQTYTNIEILLIVGKSDDKSAERCIEYQKNDNRIIVVSRNSYKLGDSRNYGLKIADGEYVAYVDVDDRIDKNYIEDLVTPLMEDESVDISCAGFDLITVNGIEQGWCPETEVVNCPNAGLFFEKIPYGVVWIKMYRRKWLLNNSIWMYSGFHEDDAYHVCLSCLVSRMALIGKTLYHYNRTNVNSITQGAQHIKEVEGALRYALDFLIEKKCLKKNITWVKWHVIKVLRSVYHLSSMEEFKREDILNLWKKYFQCKIVEDNLIIFGAGKFGIELFEIIHDKVVGFLDNNSAIQKSGDVDKKIVTLKSINEFEKREMILVSSENFFYSMASELELIGEERYMLGVDYLLQSWITEF